MDNEKLCLKWNDFQETVRKSFGELRRDNDFTDVTLVCEDQSIKAHKVILSACSPFFRKLLKSHPHPQPLVFMRGVKSSELTALVDFIYLGEASIGQEQLESFLALAEEFELKGLKAPTKRNSVSIKEKPQEFELKGLFTENSEDTTTEQSRFKYDLARNDKGNLSNMKYESKEFGVPVQSKAKQAGSIDPGTLAKIELMIERIEEGYACTDCDYTSKKKSHIMEHVEKHIKGLEYPCHFCNVVSRSSHSHSFRDHKRRCVGFQYNRWEDLLKSVP